MGDEGWELRLKFSRAAITCSSLISWESSCKKIAGLARLVKKKTELKRKVTQVLVNVFGNSRNPTFASLC